MRRSLFTLSCCLLLAACGGSAAPSAAPSSSPAAASGGGPASAASKPSAASGQAAAAQKVRGAWVAVAATQSPLWAAKEGGYFAQNGINPDLSIIRGSSTASAALISQNVDVVEMSGPGTVNASSHGAGIVMIAGFVNIAVYKLMADPSIKTVEDLKGKTIAVSQIGGQDDFILRKVLKIKGLAPTTDVQIVATKDIPGSVAALSTHQVQAAILAEPEHIPAQEAGAHVLIDITGMRIPFAATGLVATSSYVKTNRAAALNFIKSTVQGIRRIKTDRAFTDSIMSKYLKTTDKATLDAAWNTVSTVLDDKPYPSIPGLQEVIDENKVKGHQPQEFADSSLVKELDDGGFFATK